MDVIMVGSGGCMRELAWQMLEDNKSGGRWNITGYVDKEPPKGGSRLQVGDAVIPYLGDDGYLMDAGRDLNVVLSVGASAARARIAQGYLKNPHLHFPNIILGSAVTCSDLEAGMGCVIAMDARVSTNVKMGDFVFMNTGSMACHDSEIGSYVTLGPRSQLAGAVRIGGRSEVGMNATVIQCLTIGENVTVGAGAAVIRDVENDCTVAGVPARKVGCKK